MKLHRVSTAIAGLVVTLGLALQGVAASAAPGAPGLKPDFCGHDQGKVAVETYLCAQAGDIVDVRIGDVHPTQPSLGYDEVYYKLGRYTLGKDAINKKFADWCEASGLLDAAWAKPNARLDDPTSFGCALEPGQETADSKALMKTVVIGPGGSLWLTDGHHTLTSFYELADGGPNAHVRLLVTGNLSSYPTSAFRNEMVARKWVWLSDVNGNPVNFTKLPESVGLANFANDKYRSLMYFARDIGYGTDGAVPFQEFYWGAWLRVEHPELSVWDNNDPAAYLTAVDKVTHAQVALPAGAQVYGGFTREQLGTFAAWNNGKPATGGEWAKLSKPYADAKPGKIAYAMEYKAVHGLD